MYHSNGTAINDDVASATVDRILHDLVRLSANIFHTNCGSDSSKLALTTLPRTGVVV